MATWSDFLAQVRRELEEPVAAVWSDASLLWWANEAAKEFAIRTRANREWNYATLVAGTQSYTLPSDTLQVIDIYCGNTGETLNRLSRVDFNDLPRFTQTGTRGMPTQYALDDDYIYLFPTPDAGYELSYFGYFVPDDLTALTDAMPFGSRYNSCLAYYVKAKAFEQINDFASSSVMLQKYEAEVERARTQESIESQVRRSAVPNEVY